MIDFLLQDGKHASRCAVACGPGAHRGTSDAHAVSINVHDLIRQTNENDHGPRGRDLGMPGVIAGFELRCERCDRAAFRITGDCEE